VITPAIQLFAYADPATRVLDQLPQAEKLIAALRSCRRNFVELDFSGVGGVSPAFSDQFFRLAEDELAEIWLEPRNYEASCNRLVKRLLSRLERQREQAWINGCAAFATGWDAKAKGAVGGG